MESEDEINKTLILKIVCVIILIILWKLIILILEILLDGYENILIYDISYKTTFMGSIPLRIRFDKLDGFIKFMMELDIRISYLYD